MTDIRCDRPDADHCWAPVNSEWEHLEGGEDMAVDRYIDEQWYGDERPAEVTLAGYTRMQVTIPDPPPKTSSRTSLEDLDSHNAGEHPTEPTEAMHTLADRFVADIVAAYTPWACEPCECRVTLPIPASAYEEAS